MEEGNTADTRYREQTVLRSRRSRARSRGVGPRHTIDEPGEARRAILGGAWGEMRARAKENLVPSHTHRTQYGARVLQGSGGVPVVAPLANPPRWEPYAVMPLVLFCAGAISNDRPYRDDWY
jgi:hypothetical protein